MQSRDEPKQEELRMNALNSGVLIREDNDSDTEGSFEKKNQDN